MPRTTPPLAGKPKEPKPKAVKEADPKPDEDCRRLADAPKPKEEPSAKPDAKAAAKKADAQAEASRSQAKACQARRPKKRDFNADRIAALLNKIPDAADEAQPVVPDEAPAEKGEGAVERHGNDHVGQ